MSIVLYIEEEVQRQGYDTQTPDGLRRVIGMLSAWCVMMQKPDTTISLGEILRLGASVEAVNKHGLRFVGVRVGRRLCPAPELVNGLLNELLREQHSMSPLDFYRGFEMVHPFLDGNGRVGKILLNLKNNSLTNPIFPPSDFWGSPIANP